MPTPHFSTGTRESLLSTTPHNKHHQYSAVQKSIRDHEKRHKPPGEGGPTQALPRADATYQGEAGERALSIFDPNPDALSASRPGLSQFCPVSREALEPPSHCDPTRPTRPRPPSNFSLLCTQDFTLWRQARHPMYQAPCKPLRLPSKPRLWLLSRPLVLPCPVRARGLGC